MDLGGLESHLKPSALAVSKEVLTSPFSLWLTSLKSKEGLGLLEGVRLPTMLNGTD